MVRYETGRLQWKAGVKNLNNARHCLDLLQLKSFENAVLIGMFEDFTLLGTMCNWFSIVNG